MKIRIPNAGRIDLRYKANLYDYFYLTVIIGAGLFISIFAFIAAVHYRYEEALQQFRLNAGQVHTLVAANAASNELQMEVLTQYMEVNRSVTSARQLRWLKMRVQDTRFSCVSVLRVDPKTSLLWQEKVMKSGPDCERHDPTEGVVELSRIEMGAGGALSVTRVVKLDDEGATFLMLTLPREALLPKPSALANEMLIEVRAEPLEAEPSEFFLSREVSLLGERLNVGYRPLIPERNVSLGWSWLVMVTGMIITLLVGGIVFSLINRNIGVQKEVEAKTVDLREASERAIHANQTKSRFLANVSHEVRTPLNLILGMAEVLSETPVTPEQRNYIETFRRAGNHLLELVNDILDVASIEAGEVPYEEAEMSLVELMENVSDFVSVACRVKKISYNYEIDPTIPQLVLGDSKRLRQVLINLVNNSIKFTDRGGITVRLGFAADGRIAFKVHDTGIGIPQSEVEKIFGEFYQVNSSSTRARAGVGLGLSIVKTYVDHLRGSIEVKSELGVGSTFTVSLPLAPCAGGTWLEALKALRPAVKGERIAVVSSNSVQSGFIRQTLEGLGYQVNVIESGRSAVKHLSKSRAQYSSLIVDLVGKDMGGLDVLRSLDLKKAEAARTVVLCPIVHRARDPEFLADLGIHKLCYAPVKMQRLLELLSSKGMVESAVNTVAVDEPRRGLRVLIAEDDEDNRFLLQTYLASFDIELSFANDGLAALERYKGLAPQIDLLITDIQMPKMDGFELIREIRRYEVDRGLREVPIVALTADAQTEQVERVKRLGGNDYLTKPIGKAKLVSLLQKVA